MANRGRPSAAALHGDADIFEAIVQAWPELTRRQQMAKYYSTAAFPLLKEAASDIPYLEGIFYLYDQERKLKQKDEIIEQLGRMLLQDGESEETVIEMAKAAALAYHEGTPVKDIKASIIRLRKKWKSEAASDIKEGG